MAVDVGFGVVLHTRHFIRQGTEDSDLSGFFAQVREAESAGFDQVWIGDMPHIGMEDRAHADPFPVLGAMAALTTTLQIGVVPLVAPLRNPVMLAQSLATLDRIAAGRLLLGLSIGSSGRWAGSAELEFDASDATFHERAGRLSETVGILRDLWTATEPAGHEGRYYSYEPLAIQPQPMHRRAIPIYLAGTAEPALKRVARIGDGWFTSSPSVDLFRERKKMVDDFAAGYGRDPREIGVALQAAFHLDEDGDRARQEGAASLPGYTSNQPLSELSMFFGSPAEVAANVRELAGMGVRYVVARLVSNDLARQGALIQQVKALLAND
jgi:alkanesulfonate monooxygenase SsuD/methylene tetrahydromethanopterin reductase-like flavin-dependent oxidoreductase (luciferase family)